MQPLASAAVGFFGLEGLAAAAPDPPASCPSENLFPSACPPNRRLGTRRRPALSPPLFFLLNFSFGSNASPHRSGWVPPAPASTANTATHGIESSFLLQPLCCSRFNLLWCCMSHFFLTVVARPQQRRCPLLRNPANFQAEHRVVLRCRGVFCLLLGREIGRIVLWNGGFFSRLPPFRFPSQPFTLFFFFLFFGPPMPEVPWRSPLSGGYLSSVLTGKSRQASSSRGSGITFFFGGRVAHGASWIIGRFPVPPLLEAGCRDRNH